MRFEWKIAVRYFRAGGMQSVLTIMGVAVGVSVFVFISSLIGGLQEGLIERVIGSLSQVTIEPTDDDPKVLIASSNPKSTAILPSIEKFGQREAKINDWKALVARLDKDKDLSVVSPTVFGAGFAIRGNQIKPITFRGVEPERATGIVNIRKRLVNGSYDLSGQNCVIGIDLARDLGVGLKDKIRTRSSKNRELTFIVAGIYDVGIADINQRSFYISLSNAQRLLNLVGYVNAIETKIHEIFNADAIADRLQAQTGLKAKSWSRQNKEFLGALKGQSGSQYMIQTFTMVSVAFAIASVLIVSVVQKSREIGILKSMGTRTRSILLIFLMQGLFVGLIGSLVGCLIGWLLCEALLLLPGNNPAASGRLFPINLRPIYLIQAVVVSVIMGTLAGIAPARRAAKLDPVDVIRYG